MIVDSKKQAHRKDDFKKRLQDARAKQGLDQKENGTGSDDGQQGQSLSQGYRMGLEFVSAVAVGAFLGYWLDRWFGTTPIFLIALLLVGTVTGIRNLMRLLVDQSDTDDRDDMK
ncbi:ATP synthase protein I [alpha proteobacterium Q-1]|nr:ATP synthase protein I [alpha proteobacterium Q-1]